MKPVVRFDFTGPFFDRDPTKTLRDNIRHMLERLAEEGEADVKAQIAGKAASMRHSTGWTEDHVVGRVSSMSGKRWALNMVISSNTDGMSRDDAIRTRAAAATVEARWHPFRRTTSRMRRARSVITANLTKGIE